MFLLDFHDIHSFGVTIPLRDSRCYHCSTADYFADQQHFTTCAQIQAKIRNEQNEKGDDSPLLANDPTPKSGYGQISY